MKISFELVYEKYNNLHSQLNESLQLHQTLLHNENIDVASIHLLIDLYLVHKIMLLKTNNLNPSNDMEKKLRKLILVFDYLEKHDKRNEVINLLLHEGINSPLVEILERNHSPLYVDALISLNANTQNGASIKSGQDKHRVLK